MLLPPVTKQYLINFDFLSVGIDGQRLALAALAGLDLSNDDGAHVGVLVNDGHHEWTVDVALKRRQRVQVWNERLLSEIRCLWSPKINIPATSWAAEGNKCFDPLNRVVVCLN